MTSRNSNYFAASSRADYWSWLACSSWDLDQQLALNLTATIPKEVSKEHGACWLRSATVPRGSR